MVSSALIEYLKYANTKASPLCVNIVLNQTFRVNGVAVIGAVVTPATKSQHLIGHAFDCNIVDGDSWNNSKAFEDSEQTENAKSFIKAMKDKGLRWGGDFDDVDTAHFDKLVLRTSIDYECKFFQSENDFRESKYPTSD